MYRYWENDMEKILVIADDFSGAYDVGMQLKNQGFDISIADEKIDEEISGAYIYNSETRKVSKEEAYEVIRTFCNEIDISTFDIIYKKIDSTLRGNICVEIRALDDTNQFDLIIVAPAYPELARIVLNEIVYINGTPILDTDLLMDPEGEIISNNLKELMENEMGEEVEHIDINRLRKDKNLFNVTKRIVSFDSISNKDLEKIVSCFRNKNKKILWVGSIGLIQALVRDTTRQKVTLSIVGSVADVSRKQIEYAEQNGAVVIYLDIKDIIVNNSQKKYFDEAIYSLQSGNDVIICTSRSREDIISEIRLKNCVVGKKDISAVINKVLSKLARDIMAAIKLEGILLSGGDTAHSIVKQNSKFYPQIVSEVFPSIPLTIQKVDKRKYLKVIIKSGRVGELETLYFCINKLKE